MIKTRELTQALTSSSLLPYDSDEDEDSGDTPTCKPGRSRSERRYARLSAANLPPYELPTPAPAPEEVFHCEAPLLW